MYNAYAILPWLADRLREYANAAIMLCIAAGAALTLAVVTAHGPSAPTRFGSAVNFAPPSGAQPAANALPKNLTSGLTSGLLAQQDRKTGTAFGIDLPRRELGLAAPFIFRGSGAARENAVNCLAAAAWYEAGGDPEGQRAVIQVVLNRVKHPAFPKTVCAVVFEGWERPTGCQFTFTCDGSLQQRAPSPVAWSLARVRAQAALDGAIDPAVMQATHYHADYVLPWWSKSLEAVAKVGPHIFYRWPGPRGALTARPGVDNGTGIGTGAQIVPLARTGAALPGAKAAPGIEYQTDFITADPARAAARTASGSDGRTEPGTLFAEVDQATPAGRWALDALGRCAGKSACMVLGYGGADQVARNRQLSAVQRDRPLFLFVRDRASGMELALWDCARIARPNASQCQPTGKAELQRLMTPRTD